MQSRVKGRMRETGHTRSILRLYATLQARSTDLLEREVAQAGNSWSTGTTAQGAVGRRLAVPIRQYAFPSRRQGVGVGADRTTPLARTSARRVVRAQHGINEKSTP